MQYIIAVTVLVFATPTRGVLTTSAEQATVTGANPWMVWIPVASAVIAGAALAVSLASHRVSRRALALTKQQEERRTARLDLSVSQSISWRPEGRGRRWIAVEALAVNPTDRDGAIVEAELNATYQPSVGSELVVKVPHSSDAVLPQDRLALDIPVPIPANGAIKGWFIFELDDHLINAPIDRFDVVVRDSRGPVERLEVWIMHEVEDT